MINRELRPRIVRIDDPKLASFLGRSAVIFTSLEGENPGCSIKDHMVVGHLNRLLAAGALRGKTVAEASAGSTARSLAHYSREAGVPCSLYVLDTLPESARTELRGMGAIVTAVPMETAWDEYERFCSRPEIVAFDQHGDPSKRAFYRRIGEEAEKAAGRVDAIIGAIGTSHSLIGAAEGYSVKPRVVTAEPRTAHVSGIRNLDTQRFGPRDKVKESDFDLRILVDDRDFYPESRLLTDAGEITFPDSFRVTLGALRSYLRSEGHLETPRIFALGAANRRS